MAEPKSTDRTERQRLLISLSLMTGLASVLFVRQIRLVGRSDQAFRLECPWSCK